MIVKEETANLSPTNKLTLVKVRSPPPPVLVTVPLNISEPPLLKTLHLDAVPALIVVSVVMLLAETEPLSAAPNAGFVKGSVAHSLSAASRICRLPAAPPLSISSTMPFKAAFLARVVRVIATAPT